MLIADSHFLTGAILSLALPLGVLLVVLVYWAAVLRKRPERLR
jgi:hypothetical protein